MEKIVFLDMNNNKYVIVPNKISYIPMKIEHSSSGLYSGGKEMEAEISDVDFLSTVDRVETIYNNKELHTNQRRMLTSRLYWKDDEAEYQVILSKSSTMTVLLKWFNSLLGV